VSPRSLTTSVASNLRAEATVGVTAEHDDLLRAETPGSDDAAETHRAITHDGGGLAGCTCALSAA
jgi:hypothetical protein